VSTYSRAPKALNLVQRVARVVRLRRDHHRGLHPRRGGRALRPPADHHHRRQRHLRPAAGSGGERRGAGVATGHGAAGGRREREHGGGGPAVSYSRRREHGDRGGALSGVRRGCVEVPGDADGESCSGGGALREQQRGGEGQGRPQLALGQQRWRDCKQVLVVQLDCLFHDVIIQNGVE
jgi:hypothetical protein